MNKNKLTVEKLVEIINTEFAPPAFPKHYVQAEMASGAIAMRIGSRRIDIGLDGELLSSNKETYSAWKPPERYPDSELEGVFSRRREEHRDDMRRQAKSIYKAGDTK